MLENVTFTRNLLLEEEISIMSSPFCFVFFAGCIDQHYYYLDFETQSVVIFFNKNKDQNCLQ